MNNVEIGGKEQWMHQYILYASITTDGFLFNYEKTKVDAVKKNNLLTIWFSSISAVIGMLALIISLINLNIIMEDHNYKLKSNPSPANIKPLGKGVKKLQQDPLHLQVIYPKKALSIQTKKN